ncbi:site-specific DNA-methyltransferase [Pontibacter rugosus]|uniref:site-specific DNA-methyltransferase (adenine-specific) n=1 Tax=Pontibacter rugosus TaxID=1745966 RepID=A0ABW3SU59_9BACT
MPKLQTEKLPLSSKDLTQALLDQLKVTVPQIFSEDKIDFTKLREVLGESIQESPERYGLTWAGKREAFRNVQTPSIGTLRPQFGESINWSNAENLIIEGENLEVLKLLQKAYHGKVKLIYIDPPYNTGNEFIYPDNYREGLEEYLQYTKQLSEDGTAASSNRETSGRYHSSWLSMMYPRLFLARNLLKEDGVVMISIDDHEMHNLRLLMDEVFGEENFIATMIWEKGRKNDAKLISVGHEYLLIYARSQQELRNKNTIWREEKPGAREIWNKYLELRQQYGENNLAIEKDLSAWFSSLPKSHPAKKWSRYKRVDAYGPWRDRDISWPGGNGPRYDVIHPKTGLPCAIPEAGWRYSKPEEMQRQIDLGLVEFREDHTQPPFRKAHIRPLANNIEKSLSSDDNEADDEGFATQVRGSYFYKQSQVTVKYLRKLMGAKVFDNPKDYEELAKLFRYLMGGDTSGIVLDFFAGSGSTAEAVLTLNEEDGGNRQFILVQLPEKTDNSKYPTIAHITRDRIRRVINKLNSTEVDSQSFSPNIVKKRGFRAFNLDSSNFKIWQDKENFTSLAQQIEMFANNLMPNRSDDDRLYEIVLKSGLSLASTIEPISVAGELAYALSDGNVVIFLSQRINIEVLREIFNPSIESGRPVPQAILCLDAAFSGNDSLKTNAVLEAQSLGIIFKTV